MADSLARVFYEKAVAGGATFLRQLVAERTPENEWLDFKSADHLDDNELKVTWSRALCGFANNEGGVLVWGIDARFDKATKVDVACDVKLAPSPCALRDRLRQLHPTATDPSLTGVESTAVFDTGNDGPGFVISFVPESDVKPHRAEYMEGKPYMLRIGDTFKNPSPSILRNLFFPRSHARLGVSVVPDWDPISRWAGSEAPRDIEIRYRMTLHNSGIVSARDVFAILETTPPKLVIETPYKSTKTQTQFGTGIEYTRPLHPMSAGSLGLVRQRVGVTTRTSTGESTLVPRATHFAATFHIYCADTVPVILRAIVTDREVDERATKWAEPVSSGG
jgi:hypothetical protein